MKIKRKSSLVLIGLLILSTVIISCGYYEKKRRERVTFYPLEIDSLEVGRTYKLDVTTKRAGSYDLSFVVYSPKRGKAIVDQETYNSYWNEDYTIPATFEITTIKKDNGQIISQTVITHPHLRASYFGRSGYIKRYTRLQQNEQYTILIKCLETSDWLNNLSLQFKFTKQYKGK